MKRSIFFREESSNIPRKYYGLHKVCVNQMKQISKQNRLFLPNYYKPDQKWWFEPIRPPILIYYLKKDERQCFIKCKNLSVASFS